MKRSERSDAEIQLSKQVVQTFLSESNRASGYRGFIFRNNITKDYVVAHTGTEFDTDKFRDGLLTDAQMWLMKVNQQLDDARSGGTGHQNDQA